jgi:hypothetical protein
MTRLLNRRDALGSIVGAAAGLWVARAFGSVADGFDPHQPLTATRVSPRLAVFGGAGGNVVAARGTDGLALVDGGLEARSAELLKLVLGEMNSPRVDVLFNTHWHPSESDRTLRSDRQARRSSRTRIRSCGSAP